MSSGSLMHMSDPALFGWHDGLARADYVFATYHVVAHCVPEAAAMGMAMEQSASTVSIAGYVTPQQVAAWTIRVVSARPGAPALAGPVRPYALQTEVYGTAASGMVCVCELAIPKCLLAASYTQLLNVLVGEIPRLGFITSFQLASVTGLEDCYGPGPGWGVAGIREHFGVRQGALLCRSMRPAVGLDTATMARLTHDVLAGGFHCVKDDELMVFASNAQFEAHVKAMVAARDQAGVLAGERKFYLATMICDPEDLERRWAICLEQGVDGVLVAPFIQGLGVLAQLARRRRLPILAHNTVGELLSRNAQWGVAEPVWNTVLRLAGADWLVTSGGYGNELPPVEEERQALEAMRRPLPGVAPTLPILQGGKRPQDMRTYAACCASHDYMLIVASWVDGYRDGLAAGAGVFRAAVDADARLPAVSLVV